ncbi:hypothetical protein EYR36_007931 [Pleurotus pulmonarius]|nr:hypothetical protein EYR36_007931 [Pleurotus pulmonarius]
MKGLAASLLLAAVAHCAYGHGGHEHSGPSQGETIQQYAQRHMSSEHHIDSFDIRSFFQLHDLNRDGMWDKEEIEAVYGVHHVYSQKKSKDDIEHQEKAEQIVKTVLARIDANNDGVITAEELVAVGLDGLPNFDNLGAEGHHYDVESEFFLHHEEMYHSTPETQTDESYNHPEDLEHFAQHESIERKEAEKEAKFQGISVEEVLKSHEEHAPDGAAPVNPPVPGEGQHVFDEHPPNDHVPPPAPADPPHPKYTRAASQDPTTKYKEAERASNQKAEWGQGPDGYKPPVNPADKLRRNVPYKKERMQYKFRRNWGDF